MGVLVCINEYRARRSRDTKAAHNEAYAAQLAVQKLISQNLRYRRAVERARERRLT